MAMGVSSKNGRRKPAIPPRTKVRGILAWPTLMKVVVQEKYDLIQFAGLTVFDERASAYLQGIRITGYDIHVDNIINLVLHEIFGNTYYPMKLLFTYNFNEYNDAGDPRLSFTFMENIDKAEERLRSREHLDECITSFKNLISRNAHYYKFLEPIHGDDNRLERRWMAYLNSLESVKAMDEEHYHEVLGRVVEDLRQICRKLDKN